MAEIKTVEQYVLQQQLRPLAERIASDLHDLADAVAGEVRWLDRVGEGQTTYGTVADAIIQKIMNALPNLQLGHLAKLAAEADAARAKGE